MITWKAHAKCDNWNCSAETEVTITLKAERQLEITEPEGWRVHYRGDYSSYPDLDNVPSPDMHGDPIEILCHDHSY